MEILPLNRKILLKPIEEKKESTSAGGIFLPEKEEYGPKKAEVIAIGDKVELKLKKGDKVFYQDIGIDKIDEKILIDENKIIAQIK